MINVDKGFEKRPRAARHNRTKQEQQAALKKMKKALIDGLPCKVAALEGGYDPASGCMFFKIQTGITMSEFQKQHKLTL